MSEDRLAIGGFSTGDEQEQLLAEVERLRGIVADYENRIVWDTTCANCANMLDRSHRDYERAERLREAVEALADKWAATRVVVAAPGYSDPLAESRRAAAKQLRAVIADAAPDPTPNTGERPKRHLHSRRVTEQCIHRGPDCCVDCCEPGGAFETPTASSVDDKAGEQ